MNSLKRKATSALDADDNKKTKPNGSIMTFFNVKNSPPGPSAGASGSAAPVVTPGFNKEKWVASLTQDQRDLLGLEIETLHDSWLAMLKDDIVQDDFLNLKRFLNREAAAGKTIFPPRNDIYSWSRLTPFNTIKIVIVGQDPYHNHNQAHGLAFSVRPPTTTPPSLRNMYVCLKNDYPDFETPPKTNGLLTPWAERGVLLLNTCLTVRAHEANSHANRGWERFTQRVIDLVAQKRTKGVVFMAWGTPAGKRVVKVDQKKHLVLKAVHPSPLSASRGYFTCGHFRKANEWLVTRYGPGSEVDWTLVPGPKKVKIVVSPDVTTPKQRIGKIDEEQEEEEEGETTPKASKIAPRNREPQQAENLEEPASETQEESDNTEDKENKNVPSSPPAPVIHEDAEDTESTPVAASGSKPVVETPADTKIVTDDDKENKKEETTA